MRVFGKAAACLGAARLAGVKPGEFARAKLGRDDADAADVADAVDIALRTKSAVGGVEYGSASGTPAFSSVAQGVFDQTILGQLLSARRLPFANQVAAGSIRGVGANWRKDGRAIRVAPVSFGGVALHERSVGGIAVVSGEFAELAIRDGSSADTLSRLLRDAIRREVDGVFCAANAGVTGQQPAGLGYNAVSIASTGATASTIAADVRSMVGAMVGGGVSLRAGATWIISSEAYSSLATLKVLDANGTTLAGRPVVTDAPSGTFLLVATDYLSYARSDDVQIAVSTAGTIEMDSAPTGDIVTPTSASQSMISLFQSDGVALRAVLNVDWALSGPSDSSGNFACIALTGASWT